MNLISEKTNKRKFWIAAAIIFVLFILLMAVFTFFDYHAVKAVYNPDSFFAKLFDILATVLPFVSFCCMVTFFFLRKRNRTFATLFYIFFISNFAFAMHYCFVWVIKLFWGRVRFVNLGNFTYWFIPNGFTNNYSFPSAHASASAIIGVLILTCIMFDLKKWKKWMLCIIAIAFASLTAYSRLVMGAHYPTDVIFSLFTAVAAYVVTVLMVDRVIKKRR